MLAEAGIQNYLKTLDSRLRGNDVKGCYKTFYESINLHSSFIYVIKSKYIGNTPNPMPNISVTTKPSFMIRGM